MKRWFVFFFLVVVIATVAGLGLFSEASTAEETAGAVGRSKLLILSAIAFGGFSFVAWMVYASHRQRRGRKAHLDPEAQAQSFEQHGHGHDQRPSRSR